MRLKYPFKHQSQMKCKLSPLLYFSSYLGTFFILFDCFNLYFVKSKIILKIVSKDIIELNEKIYLTKIKHCRLT